MLVCSTRNSGHSMEALEAVLKGIADDGGLFVPGEFIKMSPEDIKEICGMSYARAAAKILGYFFDIHNLEELTQRAYSDFDSDSTAPIKRLSDSEYILELWHGPTLAFKDMALQALPLLMSEGIKKHGKKIMILTATSGDTGKAALQGFANVAGTSIVVFYPNDGVSDMQKLQMITQQGENTFVCAVNGNFDDAQNGVKALFGDKEFNKVINEKGVELSSANSINFGRLVPQIVYYVYAYAQLINSGAINLGDEINIVVPTGNFGNILAAYYAKLMGLPVKKLICASNKNNVLTDFFNKGKYDKNRAFYKTMSPSMDILISSNLERLLFEVIGRDSQKVKEWMSALSGKGEYTIDESIKATLNNDFYADCADEDATRAAIKRVFNNYGYLMDTHTAVAQQVYTDYVNQTGDKTVSVIASTASPYKFAQDVLFALTEQSESEPFEAARKLSEYSRTAIPWQIDELKTAKVRHTGVYDKNELNSAVLKFLGEYYG